jgi:hypothetical protein
VFRKLLELVGRTDGEDAASQEKHEPDGESIEEAVVIQAQSSMDGVPKEYEWLAKRFGRQGQDWIMRSQALSGHANRVYDIITIQLADGSEKQIYFDITGFMGGGRRG